MKRIIKDAWLRVSPNTFAAAQSTYARRNIERSCIQDGRFELAKKIAVALDSKVHSGPFEGMVLKPELFNQHMSPKLLGTYEDELHAFLFKIKAMEVDHVANIGSAEGYYSVGACLLWKRAIVDAFELDRKSREVTREHGRLNHVMDRLRVNGRAEPETFEERLCKAKLPVVISDCEGFEVNLLDPQRAPSLKRSIIICEMHPSREPQVKTILGSRFETSHSIQVVTPKKKLATEYGETLQTLKLTQDECNMAINEYRSDTPWFLATPVGYSSSEKV